MRYKVEGGTARFGNEMVLQLSKEQAAKREHALEQVKGGYRPKTVVEFKVGERLGIDCKPGDLPGNLGAVLAPEGGKTTVAQARSKRSRQSSPKPAKTAKKPAKRSSPSANATKADGVKAEPGARLPSDPQAAGNT